MPCRTVSDGQMRFANGPLFFLFRLCTDTGMYFCVASAEKGTALAKDCERNLTHHIRCPVGSSVAVLWSPVLFCVAPCRGEPGKDPIISGPSLPLP